MRSCYVPTEKFSLLSVNSSWACLVFSTYPTSHPPLNTFYTTGPWSTVKKTNTLVRSALLTLLLIQVMQYT